MEKKPHEIFCRNKKIRFHTIIKLKKFKFCIRIDYYRNENLKQTHQVEAHCVGDNVSIMSLGSVHT